MGVFVGKDFLCKVKLKTRPCKFTGIKICAEQFWFISSDLTFTLSFKV